MRGFSLAFLSGVTALLFFQRLLDFYFVSALLLITVLLFGFLHSRYFAVLFLGLILGLAWGTWCAQWRLHTVLNPEIENKDVLVQGIIASIPEKMGNGERFQFQIKELQYLNKNEVTPGLVRLSWIGRPALLHVGDLWQLQVRLKKPHATLNPGGFDYEAWLFANDIRATGYVRENNNNRLLVAHFFSHPIDRVRQTIASFIVTQLANSPVVGFITALTVGVRDQITTQQWQTLRNTGTNHLMAIAGLHVGMLSGFIFFLTGFVWRHLLLVFSTTRISKIPAQEVATWAALIAAVFYSALAGFSLPTQRAIIMLSIFLLAVLLRRHIAPWQALLFALLLVLILEPLSILDSSFWLSFTVVACIIYAMSSRLKTNTIWWKWGRVQWIIAIGITPLTLLFFQQVSLIGFIANMLAIPYIGFLILPLCLLAVLTLFFSSQVASVIFHIAAKLLTWFWPLMQYFATIPWLQWQTVIPNHWILLSSFVGIILLLAPRGFPGRYLGFFWLLPLFFYPVSTPQKNQLWFTLLDVGQGLSAVVRTQHHVLIFDTGAKFNAHFDMGSSVVVPYLYAIGVHHVDTLVISHRDNDHIGGAASLLSAMPVAEIITSVPQRFTPRIAKQCEQGENWQWDGVNFEFLYPPVGQGDLDNDSSCVLKITTGTQNLLLTGDIERKSEVYLLNHELSLLPATVLIAPHHGSNTSSTVNFVEAVAPRYVFYPVGYLNRYHFPSQIVMARYSEIHAEQFDSATAGALFLEMDGNTVSFPESQRKIHGKFWNAE